uniref:NB-ARC domain-containing protein n=1 Tax=Fagus sylvatica TaxID=28930 RepID=A0A2N9GGH9_FAGSY
MFALSEFGGQEEWVRQLLLELFMEWFSNQFEACSFIANVREVNETHGLLQLQKTLLNELLLEKDVNIGEVDNGVFIIKNRLRHKKILLVLDDVNELEQLMKLAGENDWFGPGSRVIITTRDEHLLKSREVDGIYEAEGLDYDESFHLFNLKAFKKEHPTEDFLELSQAFVNYANGLPLAIEVLGSSLFTRSIDEWNSALGNRSGSRHSPKVAGTKKSTLEPRSLFKMKSLKVLEIHNVNLLCGPKILPNSLRLLDWSCYPSKSLPSLDKLKVIQLKNSIQLIETPDFTKVPNLEELVLEDCINLLGDAQNTDYCQQMIIVIPGSEIPEWFSHQSMGPEISEIRFSKSLVEYDANGFCQIGIRFEIDYPGKETFRSSKEVKKCGFRLLYKKDIEDPIPTTAQCSNNNITPYEGLDVPHHNFNNWTVLTEGNKVKRSRDEYDGAGPSGEGSSNDVPHPKRIERPTEFGNSDSEESSEYKDCDEELSDVQ